MSRPADPAPALSPAFAARFRSTAGPEGQLRFDRFMALALYDPEVGYYRRDRPRVGYRPDADFITATSSGAIFGELVVAACVSLLGRERAVRCTFVEVGAEPGSSVLHDVAHPFAGTATFRLGDEVILPDECILFSNELFDAQPCRRFVRVDGAWHERYVRLMGDERLENATRPAEELPAVLPAAAPEGYQLDLPLASRSLAKTFLRSRWRGLFVAFDYGKTWQQLFQETPQGTLRAYWRQQQQTDLLARPGEQDLTSHVCWDWLEEELRGAGFAPIGLEFQESFFVKHAGGLISTVVASEAERLSRRKMSLLQLLHPGNMGQKFQVLWGLRGSEDSP